MPSFRTYRDDKNIYSVDMMLAYVNSHKHSVIKLKIEDIIPQLEANIWGEWSPMTVLKKMDVKKYAEDAERIKKADLAYPIMVNGKHTILDGYHRVAKAHLEGHKEIKAYVFDQPLMKKFIIDKDLDFVRVHQRMSVADILELWNKRFC